MKATALQERVRGEKKLTDPRALDTKNLPSLPAPRPRGLALISLLSHQHPACTATAGRELPLPGLAGHSRWGQLTKGKTGDTHTPNQDTKIMLPKITGDDRSDRDFAWLSTAGVRRESAEQGGLPTGRRRAGTNEAHVWAPAGFGFSSQCPTSALLPRGRASNRRAVHKLYCYKPSSESRDAPEAPGSTLSPTAPPKKPPTFTCKGTW